jgi:hypothetical protein
MSKIKEQTHAYCVNVLQPKMQTDLELRKKSQDEVTHENTCCSICKASPIKGVMYMVFE